MRKINHAILAALTLAALSIGATADDNRRPAFPAVDSKDLGVVTVPGAGSSALALSAVSPALLHSAKVALKDYDGKAQVTGVQLDGDDVIAVYEFAGKAADGTLLEVDILPNGSVEELEIAISKDAVPSAVWNALRTFAPEFEFADDAVLIEKSVRPSAVGLPQIWYEFSGVDFDVEIRSDARGIFIEPA